MIVLISYRKRNTLQVLILCPATGKFSVAPEDVEKTAYITPVGLFEFTTMPFGLSNATSSFQRSTDSILFDLK